MLVCDNPGGMAGGIIAFLIRGVSFQGQVAGEVFRLVSRTSALATRKNTAIMRNGIFPLREQFLQYRFFLSDRKLDL
jgi:hypothetical protein